MSDLFKCKKPGTKCCAPKSSIKEILDKSDEEILNKELATLPTTIIYPSSTSRVQPIGTSEFHTTKLLTKYKLGFLATELTSTLSTTIRAPVFNKYVCGVKGTARQGRVVGGEDGEQGEWCWQAALINSMNQYVCGAALIGTQWVLTAAHCITKYVGIKRKLERIISKIPNETQYVCIRMFNGKI